VDNTLKHLIFSIKDESSFKKVALQVFYFQAEHNSVYAKFIKLLGKKADQIHSIDQIPFLPVELFKTHQIISSNAAVQKIFTSSGTTTNIPARHYVTDLSVYENSFRNGFELFYGDVKDYCIIGLLPSYLEREGSSLIYMVNDLIVNSQNVNSGFYLNHYDELLEKLYKMEQRSRTTLLIGVSYALLDLAEKIKKPLNNTIIMETGGMKGKRKEMIRKELHDILCRKTGVEKIHYEYGMTELLSQAYSLENGIFKCPPWMRLLTYDPNDPFQLLTSGKSGGINVIDLANINSCSFIQTRDMGRIYYDGYFTVEGRFDFSDMRGCNLMFE
jgi:hypothetical protein